jgi:ABC-2 type transport system ATP-binding protein
MCPLIQVKNISKKFGRQQALNNISIDVERGHIIGLLGPNGSGKSTFLNCLAGLQHLSAGEILVNNISTRNPLVKGQLSYMPVADIFQKHWTVKETIGYFKLLFTDFDAEKCLRLLNEMDISIKQSFKQMSSGTLGKTKLIFTLSRQVPLYLLDEPFANIDLIAREEIYAIILREFNEESTMILSTHFLNEVEMLFEEVILLKSGEFTARFHVEDLRENSDQSIVAFYKEEISK